MATPFSGGDEEDRTLDLTDANRTLSQLSYAPIPCPFIRHEHYIIAFNGFCQGENGDFFENSAEIGPPFAETDG